MQEFDPKNFKRMTKAEFDAKVASDKDFAKTYNKLDEVGKAVYEKANKLGIHYWDHPKPGFNTYMVSGHLCITQVINNPEQYPIPAPVAPAGFELKDHPSVGTAEVYPKMFYCVGPTLNDQSIVQICRCYYQRVKNPTPYPNKQNYASYKEWWKDAKHYSDVLDIRVHEDSWKFKFDNNEVIAYWAEQFGIKLVRTGRQCLSGYYKLASTDIVWDKDQAPPEAPQMAVVDQKAKRRAAALKAWETMRAKAIS